MKPVLIFEHIESSGAGLFAQFLKQQAIPFRTLYPNKGDDIPAENDLSTYSGLCFLGGVESVAKPTDAMLDEIRLIQHAQEMNIPMIGHCLGGQLISRALGEQVRKHDVEEFGWSRLSLEQNSAASDWLSNPADELLAMQWHSDSFSIPREATKIISGDYCDNQAFVCGNILAMQFHIEIDMATISHWALALKEKHPPQSASVQSGETIMSLANDYFPVSRDIAHQLYSRWIEFL